VPAANLHVAPAGVSLDHLVLAEPGACASHCVERLGAAAARDVLVIGAGTIGLAVVQALRITGAGHVTVIEPDRRKCELALTLGAHEAYAPGDLPDERTFVGVIDVVARQATLDDAVRRVRPGGRVLLMGVPSGPLSFDAPAVQRFERDIVSSGMYVPGDFDRAVGWIAEGSFVVEPLLTDSYTIGDCAAAFARAEQPDSIKVVIDLQAGDPS